MSDVGGGDVRDDVSSIPLQQDEFLGIVTPGDKDAAVTLGVKSTTIAPGNNNDDTGVKLRPNPKMTEIGKVHFVKKLKKLINTASKRLNKHIDVVLTPLLDSSMIDAVNSETTILDRLYTEIADNNARLCEALDSDDEGEEYAAAVAGMDEVDKVYFGAKEKTSTWQLRRDQEVQLRERNLSDRGSQYSRSSSGGSRKSRQSSKSKSSSNSSSSSISMKLKAQIAGLKAEAEAIKRTSEAQLTAALLKKEQKIKKIEAMEKVYAQSTNHKEADLNENVDLRRKHPLPTSHRETELKENVDYPRKPILPERDAGELPEAQLQCAVMDMMRLQCAPKPDLDVFSGDPLDYFYFRASFREVVEATIPDQRGRLMRLIKYTAGDAKDLIKHLVHADPNTCYDEAIQLLDKEFGNPHLISYSYIKELRQWETVKQQDAAGFKKLYRFLLKCRAYKSTDRLTELDSVDMIRTIICKVHTSYQERWNRKAAEIRRKNKKEAGFLDLLEYMESEATLMSDPAYSRDALADASKQIKTNSTLMAEKDQQFVRIVVSCPLCRSNHDLEQCETYLAQGVDERYKTVFQQRLCFSCLGPVGQDHFGKSCGSKRKCIVCSEDHPTTLHGGKVKKNNLASLGCTVISMCVVAVQLWHKRDETKRITVYALLDDCSQGTFIKDDVLESLDIPNLKHKPIVVKTLNGSSVQDSIEVEGLIVEGVPSHAARYKISKLDLPTAYSRQFLAVDPEEIPTPSKIRCWDHLAEIVEKIPDYDPSIPIGLMIGGDCPKANEPVEVIPSDNGGPYAKRTSLGWCIIGPINSCSASQFVYSNCTRMRGAIPVKDVSTGMVSSHVFATKNTIQDMQTTNMLKKMYLTDFNESASEKIGMSVEDRKFLEIMEEGVTKKHGHYQLPLPFRNNDLHLPDNRKQALGRLKTLKRKLQADEEYKAAYDKFVQSLISNGHAKIADVSKDKKGKVWRVPHFGVFNAKKGKLRMVYDFSVRFQNSCLNEELIQGPNLANPMLGVILRFRKEEIAYMADVEAMFYQVLVPEEQRCFLRFLYWPDGQLDAEPVEYEMCVHPFGAVSSGSCANFALKRTAQDEEHQFGSEAANALRRNFYVDDHLKSLEDVDTAKALFEATRKMCAAGGFNLTKFVSNSSELVKLVPSECLASSLIDLNMSKQQLPTEPALGIFWCLEDDTLQFRIVLQDKPLTRRGVLSTIGSVYDPTGVAGPFLLPGRKILQLITQHKGSWDDELPEDLRSAWEKWRCELPELEKIKVNRCYKPKGFKTATSFLHSFSDASDYGYGEVTYLRQVSVENEVCVSLIMAKSRVVPSKQTTIPRMELTAAVVSAKVTALVKEELDMSFTAETYWVDSMIVQGYIHNEERRFRTYVANRQRQILDLTKKERWYHVDTKHNPADYASRGLSVSEAEKVKIWLNGPSMLWETEDPAETPSVQASVPEDDPEIQQSVCCNAVVMGNKNDVLSTVETRISRWFRIKLVLARVIIFIDMLRKKRSNGIVQTEDVESAEKWILKMLQGRHFSTERIHLRNKGKLLASSKIRRLDPFLDADGILRVGGRLRKAKMPDDVKHPIILPKKEIIVHRIIEHYHRVIAHLGRTSTLNEIRGRGYWAISGNSQVNNVITNCHRCRLLRGQCESQKMADLPVKRVAEEEPPFTYCGVDMFGPFIVKEGRKELKRYGIIFTCYSCRAVHLETTTSMDTDTFILSLRRFIGRRGPVRSIRSDNGGNFVGVEGELKDALEEMDHKKIKDHLLKDSCDWIEWEKNPPEASHMGGVWERQIRTVKSVLASMLKEHAGRLNDESLRTLLIEVEAIVNSRPLAVDTLTDESLDPLTPNRLLTMKSKVVLPPPGVFQKADVYCRKRWRTVQYLANEFWGRFSKEYIRVTQERPKWDSVRRNVAVGDIVLVIDKDVKRNKWPMARVIEVFPSDDGLVRHVELKVAGSQAPLKRPVSKLVVVVEADV